MALTMPSITLRLQARQIGKYERRLGALMYRVYAQTTSKVGRSLVKDLRRRTEQNRSVWRGRVLRGWAWQRVRWDRILVHNRAEHAVWVELGRRPGSRMPPVSKLRPWALAKLGDERLAWPVAKSIAKKGIKPKPTITARSFRRTARKIINKEVLRALKQASRKAARGL